MKNRNSKVAALVLLLVFGSLAITSAGNALSRFFVFHNLMNGSNYWIYDFMTLLVTIALQVALLSFGYIRFRNILPNEKAQWVAIITSTIALTIAPIVSLLLLQITTIRGLHNDILLDMLQPAALSGNLIMTFLLSTGVVYLIAAFYKRRSSFEVE